MQKGLLVLLTLVTCSAAAGAQAQTLKLEREALVARLGPDEVVARIMSFDRNNDGRIERNELVERMQAVVVRGDRNGDSTLDRAEIKKLVIAPPPIASQEFPNTTYGFADLEDVLFSRHHIESALDDLRLPSSARKSAAAVIDAYVGALERKLSAGLLSEMRDILPPQRFLDFKHAVTSHLTEKTDQPTSANDSRARSVAGMSLDQVVPQLRIGLRPTEVKLASAVIERYNARLRLGNRTERDELLARLSGILTEEDRDNFRAAIERRPVVPKGEPTLVAGSQVRTPSVNQRIPSLNGVGPLSRELAVPNRK